MRETEIDSTFSIKTSLLTDETKRSQYSHHTPPSTRPLEPTEQVHDGETVNSRGPEFFHQVPRGSCGSTRPTTVVLVESLLTPGPERTIRSLKFSSIAGGTSYGTSSLPVQPHLLDSAVLACPGVSTTSRGRVDLKGTEPSPPRS